MNTFHDGEFFFPSYYFGIERQWPRTNLDENDHWTSYTWVSYLPKCNHSVKLGKNSNTIFMITCTISFFENFLISSLAPFFPEYAKESCGASPTLTGIILALFPLVNMFLSPVCGALSSRFGRKGMMNVGLFLLTVSTFSFGLASSVPSFFVARCLQGVASASINVGMLSLLMDSTYNATFAVAAVEVFTGLGYIFGPPVGALLFSVGGFKFTFAVLALFPFLTLVLTLISTLEVNGKKNDDTYNEINSVAGMQSKRRNNAALIFLIMINALGMSSVGFIDPIIAKHFSLIVDSSVRVAGLLYGLPSLIYSATAIITPKFIKAYGEKTTLAVGFFLIGLGYVMLGPIPLLSKLFINREETWVDLLFCLLIYGVGMAFTLVPVLPALQKSSGSEICDDFVTSMYTSSCSAGEFIGPILGGFLVQEMPKAKEVTCDQRFCLSGFPWASASFGLFNIFCSILIFLSTRQINRLNQQRKISLAGDNFEHQEPLLDGINSVYHNCDPTASISQEK